MHGFLMDTKAGGTFKLSTLNFILGLTIGLVVSSLIGSYISIPAHYIPTSFSRQRQFAGFNDGESSAVSETKNFSDNGPVHSHEELDKLQQKVREVKFEDAHAHHDDDSVAKNLFNKVRVFCWIMTAPQNLEKKAEHVRKTWAKRCNKLIFFSSETNKDFPTIGLNISEGREHLTAKTMRAFQYVYENHLSDADWFMKADDDTYVILENLRYFLSEQDTSQPIYFGHHFKTIVKQGYYSGGAGYILSKEALRRFGLNSKNGSICRQDGGAEDAELGHCMEKLGVKTANSTDSLGRSRFHCFDPETHLFGGYPEWYYQYDANGAKKGTESVSDYAISFHYVPPQKMYALEFYIYHLHPYGIQAGLQHLNRNSVTIKPRT